MNRISLRCSRRPIAGVLLSLIAGHALAQVADLSEIGTDPRRAVIVDVLLKADGTAEFQNSFVSDTEPGSTIGNPEQIRLESLDRTSTVIGTEYSWDPRWLFLEGARPDDDGVTRETMEIQDEALGSFHVLLKKDLDSVRITDVEASTELATVNVRIVVELFCADEIALNSSSPNPECIGIEFADSENDGVPDVYDNCPDAPNPNQEDVLNRGIGDACARPGDFDGDGDVDWLDVGQYLGAGMLNQPAYVPGDSGYDLRPFDLSGDGTINILDLRKAWLLCDLLKCEIIK